jgi:hypothetical protein
LATSLHLSFAFAAYRSSRGTFDLIELPHHERVPYIAHMWRCRGRAI